MIIRGKMTPTSILVEHGSTKVIPAPSYEGKEIGLVLRHLIEEIPLSEPILDLSVRITGSKGTMVSMRLIRAESLIDYTTGIIQVVLRPAAVGSCKAYDQKFSFSLDPKFEADGLPQITELTLGYPSYQSESWKEWVEAAEAS